MRDKPLKSLYPTKSKHKITSVHFLVDKEDKKLLDNLQIQSKLSRTSIMKTLIYNSDKLNLFACVSVEEADIYRDEDSIRSVISSNNKKNIDIIISLEQEAMNILLNLKNQSKLSKSDILRLLIRNSNKLNIFK